MSQSTFVRYERLEAFQRAINITERLLNEEREAFQQDRFGRRATEMPLALRELYETGHWKSHDVYLWPSVLHLSRIGHERSAAADQTLDPLCYNPDTPMPEGKVIAEAAVADAVAVATRIGDRVRKVVAAQKAARVRHMCEQSKIYMLKRRLWVVQLDEEDARHSEQEREKIRQSDRELLAATKATSGMGNPMSNREVDLIFNEIEWAGGTAGGLERWGRSITAIPDQNPDYLPAPADGGGVLIENPLAEHYAARNVNPWTRAERLLFLEKYVIHGKNFRKIATFFEHKSVEDCVRFYFDNKMRLRLKQLTKDGQLRKRGNKKLALIELSKMPIESRSIKDNFMHQPGFLTPDNQDELEKEYAKVETPSPGPLGRGWTANDRQALVFALCRYDVTGDEEGKAMPTEWTSIAASVGNKTPRQCRQFYFQCKKILGLDSYSPPKPLRRSQKRPPPITPAEDPTPQKQMRRSNSVIKNGTHAVVEATVGDCYVNGGASTSGIA